MARIKMPKKPRIGASQVAWDRYEKKMADYVAKMNERTRRKSVKDKFLSKVKV